MKQATITLTDDLEHALERYRKDSASALDLDSVVQRALRSYLNEHGYLTDDASDMWSDIPDIIPSIGGKPKPMQNPPVLDDEHSVARAVIEDRR